MTSKSFFLQARQLRLYYYFKKLITKYTSKSLNKDSQNIIAISFFWISLVIIMIICGYINLYKPLSLEETQFIVRSRDLDIGQIVNRAILDFGSPVYELIVAFVFGNITSSIIALRILSLYFGIWSVFCLGYFIKQSTNNTHLAHFVSGIVGVSGAMNWFGTTIGYQSFFLMIMIIGQYIFWRITNKTKDSIISWSDNYYLFWYFLVSLIGIFCSSLYLVVLISQLITVFLIKRKIILVSTKLIWLITAILIIGIWFWMGSFWNLTSQEFIRMDLQTSDYNLFVSLSQNFFGFQSDFVTSNIINIWPILVVIFLTSLRKFRIIVEKNISHLILIVVSILLVYFGSLLNKSLFDKNNLFILIPSSSILLGSLCFASNRIYSKFFRFGSVILVVLGSFLQFVSSNVAIKEDPKSAFVYLNKYAKPNDLVLVMPAYSLILVNYYYNSIAKIESYPKWNPKQSLPKYEPKNTKNDIQIISSKYPKIFVVTKSLEKYESEVINELLITKRISKSISFDSTLKIIELSSY